MPVTGASLYLVVVGYTNFIFTNFLQIYLIFTAMFIAIGAILRITGVHLENILKYNTNNTPKPSSYSME